MEKIDILGIKFNNVSLSEAVKKCSEWLSSSGNYYIVTPNPEFVVDSLKDKEFKDILNKADLSVPDGIGVIWAGRIVGRRFKERVTGADLVNKLLEEGNTKGCSFFFLGGEGGSAKRAAERAITSYKNLRIGYYEGGPGQEFDELARNHLNNFSRKTSVIDFLLVGYGQKKQEKWIARNLDVIPVKVAIGVGGVLDYLSLKKFRAPKLIRQHGFEWLFRLLQEPRRWRRQLALPYFVYLILKERKAPH